jgi:egghead protein (zeste-white 4 protein)
LLSPLLALALGVVLMQLAASISALTAALLSSKISRKASGSGGCGRRLSPREIEFVIVTKGTPSVLGVLREVIVRTKRLLPGYTLWVVTDHDSPGLETLRLWRWELGFNLVVVPPEYGRGRYKSRAIQYFINRHVDPRKWYVFLDDDSYPLDDRFLCELRDEVPVYNGYIYPRRGRSILAWVADGSRYYHSLTRQRLALNVFHKPVYGLHGELLIVKGWVLKRIPMASDSLAEDALYAARLIRAGIPVGMVSTRVSILSPHSVRDFWRQRARWNLGALRDMVRGLYPLSMVAGKGVDIILWLIAPLSPLAWAYVASKLHGGAHGFTVLTVLGLSLYAAFIASHGIVAIRELGAARGALLVAILLPFVTLAYYASPIYAILKSPELTRRFVLIEKSLHPAPGELSSPTPPGRVGFEESYLEATVNGGLAVASIVRSTLRA